MNNQLQGIVLSIFSNLEKSGFKESKNSAAKTQECGDRSHQSRVDGVGWALPVGMLIANVRLET